MSLLRVGNLTKRFGGVVAAQDVSFALESGELLAMIGPNGAGKSTVFNMIGGQLRPDAGTIALNGAPIAGLSPRQIAGKGVGRSFQVAQVFTSMRALDSVQAALLGRHGDSLDLVADAGARYRREAQELLALLDMGALSDTPVATLAYGDVKRLELAMALAGDPVLLLMDEPTAGMAPEERGALMALVARLAREKQIGVLFTEHDMDSVFGHADRVLVLAEGRVIACDTPENVRADAQVRKLYLGEETAA